MIAREVLRSLDSDRAQIALVLSDNATALERAGALKKLLESSTPEALDAVRRALQFWIQRDIQEGSWWVRGTLEDIGTEKARRLIAEYSPPRRPQSRKPKQKCGS